MNLSRYKRLRLNGTSTMRLLVCGGRDFADSDFLHNVLWGFDAERGPVTCVIHGAARGADSLAMYWAQITGVKHLSFAADWKRDGRAAGPIRNQRMLDEGKPDVVIAFEGGKGTADMVARALRAGLEVLRPVRIP